MTGELAVLIALAVFVVLALLETPIGLALTGGAITGLTLIGGFRLAESVLASTPYNTVASYSLFVVPMYILLGTVIANSSIGAGVYNAVNRVVGKLPGGLGVTAVTATALFSGISGSTAADIAAFGRVSVNEMSRHGYEKSYAAAIVAAAGAFAMLIPPGIALVLYAIIAGESVGAMVIAGVIPGFLSCFVLSAAIVVTAAFSKPLRRIGERINAVRAKLVRTVRKKDTADALDEIAMRAAMRAAEGIDEVEVSIEDMKASSVGADIRAVIYVVLLFGIVVGGLYGGLFTATEAGAVGALAGVVIAFFERKKIPFHVFLPRVLRETANVTAMVFLLLIGGASFTYLIARSGVSRTIAEWVVSLPVAPLAVVGIFLLILLPMGMFIDGLSLLLITVPIAVPVFVELGFEPIWIGILLLKMVEVGAITPPVGLNGFIIAGIAKIPVGGVYRRLVPFVILDLIFTAVLFLFPEIVMWLPRLAGF